MRLKKYTEEKLKEVVAKHFSVRQAMLELGLNPAGGNYQSMKKAIAFYQIDISHFIGKGHRKGKRHSYNKRPIQDILVFGKIENTFSLKKRLIEEGIKLWVCEKCCLEKWLGSPICQKLEIHWMIVELNSASI